MLETHFNFIRIPFTGKSNLFLSLDFKELKFRFDYNYRYSGCFLITGSNGTGKTFAINYLTNQLPQDYKIIRLHAITNNIYNLLISIADNLNLSKYHQGNGMHILNSIADMIVKYYSLSQKSIIVIDHADALDCKCLDILNSLFNIVQQKGASLLYVLIGSSDFKKLFSLPSNPLKDKVLINYRFTGLSSVDELKDYCLNELKVCGSTKSIIDDNCWQVLFDHCSSSLKIVNTILLTAFSIAYLKNKFTVDLESLILAFSELDIEANLNEVNSYV